MNRNERRNQEKGRERPATAFYMETLILAAVFAAVILVLVRVFALAGQMSARSQVLTNAVHLAENAAEAVAAAESPEDLKELLEEGGNTGFQEEGGEAAGVCARYAKDMTPAEDGDFRVDITWTPKEGSGGNRIESRITVYWAEEEIYTLETAVYRKEVTP